MTNENQNETHWVVELEEDPETGDLVMPLPPAMLEGLGWKIGDTLDWKELPDGGWSLTKTAKSLDQPTESVNNIVTENALYTKERK